MGYQVNLLKGLPYLGICSRTPITTRAIPGEGIMFTIIPWLDITVFHST